MVTRFVQVALKGKRAQPHLLGMLSYTADSHSATTDRRSDTERLQHTTDLV